MISEGATERLALPPHTLGSLTSTWATGEAVRWKRRPDTMVLQEEIPPPPPSLLIAKRRKEERKEGRYEEELKEIEALKKKNQNRGTKFQYDIVSELHGFLSQKNIKQLLKQTNYNRRELYVIYVRFKALCALSPTPHGIDKHTFKKGVARLAVEDDRFVNRVFSLVDDDGSGQIEWEVSGRKERGRSIDHA
jgi:hypothetical protein